MLISNIVASLSQGNLLNKKQFFLLYIAMVICLVLPILTILLLIIPQVEWDSQMIFACTIGNIFFLSFFAVSISIIIKNDKLRKKITLWIEDAIETTAHSTRLGENRLGFQPKAVKIQVKFKINDKTYIRESTGTVFGGQEGYLGTYKKYADRDIRILYSQKYNEILILKDELSH